MRRADSNFHGRTVCVRNISLRRSIFITATLYISSVPRYSVTANRQIHSIVFPTRGIPARGENFSDKFHHAISSLPKSWEWRAESSLTFYLRALHGSVPASSSLSIKAEKLLRVFENDFRSRLCIPNSPCVQNDYYIATGHFLTSPPYNLVVTLKFYINIYNYVNISSTIYLFDKNW